MFVDIFFSFNPNRVLGINGGYFPAICWVCSLDCAEKFAHAGEKRLRTLTLQLLFEKLSESVIKPRFFLVLDLEIRESKTM